MDLPKVTSAAAVEYFAQEIRKLICSLEAHFNCSITESSLAEAIDIYNETRDLMGEVYRLRSSEQFDVSETRIHKLVQASQTRPRKLFNRELKTFVEEIKKQEPEVPKPKRPRIMIVGSILPNPGLIEIIEEAGARIVFDDLCSGRRYFDARIEKEGDLARALSRHYLLKAPCARMKDTKLRMEMAEKQVEEHRIDGIVYNTMKFCDSDLYDYAAYHNVFRNKGVPIIQIEDDGAGGNAGQIKTRIEAFVEML
jgi:benzoyl-CoA reductase/2-hydroxyglutaryl-CoA dehydratase subunit BcrC/BadD/HgdB